VEEDAQPDESTLLQSDPICSSAGCTQYKHPKKKPVDEPDYSTIPHFGPDPDIEDTLNSIRIAEKQYKHKWVFGNKESLKKWHNVAKDVLYDEDPELDDDIKVSQRNLENAEKDLDHKYELTQIDATLRSDPICGTGGCWQSEYSKRRSATIVEYPDPDEQGLDQEVKETLASSDLAEESVAKLRAEEAQNP
jgi:hypothetical protein